MAHSENYTEATPTDATLATNIDDEILKSRRMLRERFAIDHKILSSDDGTDVYGVHTRVTFEARISTPTEPTNSIATLYIKTGDYDCELRFVDERDVDNKIVIIGEVKMIMGSTIPDGWIELDGSTLGDATSGADYAGDDYKDLFYWLYAELADSEAPVSTGRGVDDDADWGAHKTLTMPDGRARMPIGAGTDGVLTDRTIGDTDGAETQDIEHTHVIADHLHAKGTLAGGSHAHTVSHPTGGDGQIANGSVYSDTPRDNAINTGGSVVTMTGSTAEATLVPEDTLSTTQDVMNPWIAFTYIIKY